MYEEELDGIETDIISNLDNLLRTVFIIWKKLLMEESLLERNLPKRSQTLYKPINVHSVTYAIGEGVSSTSMWKILKSVR